MILNYILFTYIITNLIIVTLIEIPLTIISSWNLSFEDIYDIQLGKEKSRIVKKKREKFEKFKEIGGNYVQHIIFIGKYLLFGFFIVLYKLSKK